MSVNRKCVSSSSIVSDANNDVKIVDAERCFVRKDFQMALQLANQVIQESAPKSRSSSCQVNVLKTPCLSSNSNLLLGVDDEITGVDRAGAIVLQSMKELSLVDDTMLEPFYKFYATSPMPLELLVIFITFLLASEKEHTAIELAAEVVHCLQYSPCTTSTTEEIQEAKDEIVWTLVTKLIPFCPDGRYLENLSKMSANEWQPPPAHRRKWRREPIRSIIPALINVLDSLHGIATIDCLERCRENLSTLHGGIHANASDTSRNGKPPCRAMIPRQPPSSQRSWINTLNRSEGYRQFAVRVLHFLTTRIVKPLCRQTRNWETRGGCHVAVTIFAIFVSWKQRRRIVASLFALSNLCLTPIQEILDAALEQ